MNKVFLLGNMTRDVELRTVPSGTVVGNFCIAVTEKRPDGQEDTVFADVTVWNKTAENVAKFCGKGAKVLVEGKLVMDQWTNKEGVKQSKLKVNAQIVQFITTRKENAPQGEPQAQSYAPPQGGGYAQNYPPERQGMYARNRQTQYRPNGVSPDFGPEMPPMGGDGDVAPF